MTAKLMLSGMSWNSSAYLYLLCIGRPKDFLDVLKGNIPIKPDYIIFIGHGKSGSFIMPELGSDIYEADEPREDISSAEIERHININDTVIISTACTTGCHETAYSFTAGGNRYIAPNGYIEGSSALFFIIRLFYEMLTKKLSLNDAYTLAKATDSEAAMFCLY